MFRSRDGQLLVVSSTDGYCTLITFDESELGTIYKKCEVVAPVSSQCEVVAPVSSPVKTVAPVLSPVKPVRQVVESLVEVQIAASKEYDTVPTTSITEPVNRDFSPQRKKARRVVLQTLSTNVVDFTEVPQDTAGNKTEVAKNLVVGSEPLTPNSGKCRAVMSHEDSGGNMPCSGRVDNFNSKTNCELASGSEPESIDVCGDMQVAIEVCTDSYFLMQENFKLFIH